MSRYRSPLFHKHHIAYALYALALLAAGRAWAEDTVGFYVGGAIGQSTVQASTFSIGDFNDHHSAFKAMAGLRFGAHIGAELEYFDLGHPDLSTGESPASTATDASQQGTAAFGVVYVPVSTFSVFAKAGIGRTQSTLNGFRPGVNTCVISAPNCALLRSEQTDTRFATGLGIQYECGAVALRAEYEYFSAADRHPTLASFGLTYSF